MAERKTVAKLAHLLISIARRQPIEFVHIYSCVYWLTCHRCDVLSVLGRVLLRGPFAFWLAANRQTAAFVTALAEVCMCYLQAHMIQPADWTCLWTAMIVSVASDRAARIIQRAWQARQRQRKAAVRVLEDAMLHWHYRPGGAGARRVIQRLRLTALAQ
jgi:hypothetical protein